MKPSERQERILALRKKIEADKNELDRLVRDCTHVTDDWMDARSVFDPDRVGRPLERTCAICGRRD